MTKHVIFCLPFLERPTKHVISSFEESIPVITAAGWTEGLAQEVGCAYISMARASMLRKALDAKADAVVFIDYDLSWKPTDLLKLLETEGDVVAGTYRYKKPDEEYMGGWHTDENNRPALRDDGCIRAGGVPGGFLKITRAGVGKFMRAYPELVYGDPINPSVDLFNHGAHNGVWWGEDMAFARRWNDKCGDIWLIPDLDITHWSGDTPYPGNLHRWLMRQPGGRDDPAREERARMTADDIRPASLDDPKLRVWRPIETAPKNRQVWLGRPPEIHACFNIPGAAGLSFEPTHWMPPSD